MQIPRIFFGGKVFYSSVPFIGESGIGTMKLVEGQTIELEDGTMAYVQNTPKGKKKKKKKPN